jgi:hypothetical protein
MMCGGDKLTQIVINHAKQVHKEDLTEAYMKALMKLPGFEKADFVIRVLSLAGIIINRQTSKKSYEPMLKSHAFG